MVTARVAYLIAYNGICLVGWAYCLYLAVQHLWDHTTLSDLYTDVRLPLQVTQSLAVVEILHSFTGLVRSPLATTVQQVFSRLFIVWGILSAAPASTTSRTIDIPGARDERLGLGLASVLLAWGTTEVIRYSFYALKEARGSAPFPLLWLRYTTFIVLYPLGVASEMALVRLALPELLNSRLWCLDMPNIVNMHFEYPVFVALAVLMYIPGFPGLYMYMFKQRRSLLCSPQSKATKQA